MKPVELFKEAVRFVAAEAEKGNLICLDYCELDGLEGVTLVCDDIYHAFDEEDLKKIEKRIKQGGAA